MSNEEKDLTEVEFHFEVDPSYRILASNGAMVGPTPRGEIKLDFFVESSRLPTVMVNKLTAAHGIGDLVRREPDDKGVAVRRLQAAVLLTSAQARELAKAIIQKADQLDAIWKQVGDGKDGEDDAVSG